MSTRLANTNAVSQQKSPVILVLHDVHNIKNDSQKSIFIKHDPNEEIEQSDEEESDSSHIQQQVAYFENEENDVTESGLIWSHRKPTEIDHHATEYFLQLRGTEKYKKLFADKKYGKYRVWSEIAEEMNNAGYYVGEGRGGAEKCRQKFSNLEKGLLNYMRLVRSGLKKRDPPPFYEFMYNLVDHEDKLYREEQQALIDAAVRDNLEVDILTNKDTVSSASTTSKLTENNRSESPTTPNEPKTKKFKPKNEIVSLLIKQHSEMMKQQRDYLERIEKHFTVQNEQRERMMNIFIEAIKDTSCTCKKRKRTFSENSETEPMQ